MLFQFFNNIRYYIIKDILDNYFSTHKMPDLP